MAVFCETCRQQKGWPKPVTRVTTEPCDFCGGWDQLGTRRRHPRTGEPIIRYKNLRNFHQADIQLPGTAAEARIQRAVGEDDD